MKAVIDTKDFLYELKKVMLAANAKQVHDTPIANAIKMDVAYDGTMTLTTYNFTVAIEAIVMPEEYEEGSSCVSAKALFDVISKCVSDTVEICADEESCRIKTGKAVFNLPAMNAESYAQLPKIGDIKPVTVDAVQLVEAANKVLYAAAQDDKRPEMHGVSVEIENNAINIVACDGYRLSNVKLEANSDREIKIIIPSETVSILSKIVRDTDSDAQLYASNKFIVVKMENTTITSRLIAGTYMDWRNVIPQQRAIHCVFDKSQIVRCIEMAQTVQGTSNKVTGIIIFQIENNVMNVSLTSQSGNFEDEIEFDTDGALNMSIAFNPRYLLDAIRTVGSDKVDIMIVGSLSPAFVKSKDDDSAMNMVLPVRIKQ